MNDFSDLASALEEHLGWSVAMWFYTASHSELVLQLRRRDEYEVAFLVLSGCGDVAVPALSILEKVGVEQIDDLTWTVRLSDSLVVTAETWRLCDAYQPAYTPPEAS